MKRALLVAALVGTLASPALAHRGHAGLTVVEIDPVSGAVSVVHLRQRFRLDIDGAAIPVTHAATDLAGDNVRVAFSGETTDRDITAVTIDLDFFPGVHDDQEQQVNVRINGVTRTVVFRPGSQAQTVTFGG
jgi:hypothetical protein